MPEYIEREALLRNLGFEEEKKDMVLPGSTFDVILKEPAADVAPVVRCKDCIHCDFAGWKYAICWERSKHHNFLVSKEEFCNFGERRNNNA